MRAFRVEIHINKGRVEVTGDAADDDVEIDDAEGLTVTRKRNGASINGNDADFVVRVPESTLLEVHANRAEIAILGVAGVKVHVNDAEIDIADVSGPVDVHANTVQLTLEYVAGPIAVQANSGDVLARVAPGDRVHADVQVNRGEVTNDVPPGDDVKVKVRLNKGEVTIVEGLSGR